MSPRTGKRKGPPRRQATRRNPSALPVKLFKDLYKGAGELTTIDDPLDAELLVSDLVGIWWDQRRTREDVDQLLGEGLIDYAARRADGQALALLRALQAIGTPRQRVKAGTAAEELSARGVPEPPWAHRIGDVSAGECWALRDVYGDNETLYCTFDYPGGPRHGLYVLIDYNLDGMAKDVSTIREVDAALADLQKTAAENPLASVERIPLPRARAILERAFAMTDRMSDPPVGEQFESVRAFALTRTRCLPEPDAADEEAGKPAEYSDAARAALVAEFLSSPEARELADRQAAEACATLIVEYGCDRDNGRPLRVSPIKTSLFLLGWLPRGVLLTPAERAAVPPTMTAWVRWAASRQNLPAEAVTELVAAAEDVGAAFPGVYDDPNEAGSLAALLEGVDRSDEQAADEALERRLFAMPLQGGRLGDDEYDHLNPAEPDERNLLIEIEHPEYHDALIDPTFSGEIDGVSPRLHLTAHQIVTNQLWDGDPPETWETAKRLTELGYERHDVLHMLGAVAMEHVHAALTGGEPFDPAAYKASLDALPESWHEA